jgi:DNA-binding response OmpR family regulator
MPIPCSAAIEKRVPPASGHESARPRVLIVTSEFRRANRWRATLLRRHFAVAIVRGDETVRAPATGGFADVILLDLTDAAFDGLALCRRLRADGVTLPILMLHMDGTLDDLLAGFEAGADAYLRGWYGREELPAQIGALWRRHASGEDRNSLGKQHA